MQDKNKTVKLNSSDIYLYLEPNTNSNLLRFAIYNPSHSRIKFLHNNNIYKSDDVQKAQSDFYIGYKIGTKNSYYIQILNRLTDIKLNKVLFLHSSHYSHSEISDILSSLTPLIAPNSDFFLGELLAVEKEFVKCQEKYVHTAQERQSVAKDTNEYCNF